ncbi:E3 ubiquitin-protein ligase TOM1-like [Diplonema papillatum]|nr:E3 ubiquitin-protein ligase TOM1-like [Diplonema papillatum]
MPRRGKRAHHRSTAAHDTPREKKLVFVAAATGHVEALQKLLKDEQQSVDERDAKGRDCLMLACSKGHTEAARLLLEYNIDPKHTDKAGRTALLYAVTAGSVPCVELLINHFSTRKDCWKLINLDDGQKNTPLSVAIDKADIELVKALLKDENINLLAESPSSMCLVSYAHSHTRPGDANMKAITELLVQDTHRKRNLVALWRAQDYEYSTEKVWRGDLFGSIPLTTFLQELREVVELPNMASSLNKEIYARVTASRHPIQFSPVDITVLFDSIFEDNDEPWDQPALRAEVILEAIICPLTWGDSAVASSKAEEARKAAAASKATKSSCCKESRSACTAQGNGRGAASPCSASSSGPRGTGGRGHDRPGNRGLKGEEEDGGDDSDDSEARGGKKAPESAPSRGPASPTSTRRRVVPTVTVPSTTEGSPARSAAWRRENGPANSLPRICAEPADVGKDYVVATWRALHFALFRLTSVYQQCPPEPEVLSRFAAVEDQYAALVDELSIATQFGMQTPSAQTEQGTQPVTPVSPGPRQESAVKHPVELPSEHSVKTPLKHPVEHPVEHSGEAPVEHPVEHSGETPEENPLKHPVKYSGETPVEHSVEHLGEPAVEHASPSDDSVPRKEASSGVPRAPARPEPVVEESAASDGGGRPALHGQTPRQWLERIVALLEEVADMLRGIPAGHYAGLDIDKAWLLRQVEAVPALRYGVPETADDIPEDVRDWVYNSPQLSEDYICELLIRLLGLIERDGMRIVYNLHAPSSHELPSTFCRRVSFATWLMARLHRDFVVGHRTIQQRLKAVDEVWVAVRRSLGYFLDCSPSCDRYSYLLFGMFVWMQGAIIYRSDSDPSLLQQWVRSGGADVLVPVQVNVVNAGKAQSPAKSAMKRRGSQMGRQASLRKKGSSAALHSEVAGSTHSVSPKEAHGASSSPPLLEPVVSQLHRTTPFAELFAEFSDREPVLVNFVTPYLQHAARQDARHHPHRAGSTPASPSSSQFEDPDGSFSALKHHQAGSSHSRPPTPSLLSRGRRPISLFMSTPPQPPHAPHTDTSICETPPPDYRAALFPTILGLSPADNRRCPMSFSQYLFDDEAFKLVPTFLRLFNHPPLAADAAAATEQQHRSEIGTPAEARESRPPAADAEAASCDESNTQDGIASEKPAADPLGLDVRVNWLRGWSTLIGGHRLTRLHSRNESITDYLEAQRQAEEPEPEEGAGVEVIDSKPVGELVTTVAGMQHVLCCLPLHPEYLEFCIAWQPELCQHILQFAAPRTLAVFMKHPQLIPIVPLHLRTEWLRSQASRIRRKSKGSDMRSFPFGLRAGGLQFKNDAADRKSSGPASPDESPTSKMKRTIRDVRIVGNVFPLYQVFNVPKWSVPQCPNVAGNGCLGSDLWSSSSSEDDSFSGSGSGDLLDAFTLNHLEDLDDAVSHNTQRQDPSAQPIKPPLEQRATPKNGERPPADPSPRRYTAVSYSIMDDLTTPTRDLTYPLADIQGLCGQSNADSSDDGDGMPNGPEGGAGVYIVYPSVVARAYNKAEDKDHCMAQVAASHYGYEVVLAVPCGADWLRGCTTGLYFRASDFHFLFLAGSAERRFSLPDSFPDVDTIEFTDEGTVDSRVYVAARGRPPSSFSGARSWEQLRAEVAAAFARPEAAVHLHIRHSVQTFRTSPRLQPHIGSGSWADTEVTSTEKWPPETCSLEKPLRISFAESDDDQPPPNGGLLFPAADEEANEASSHNGEARGESGEESSTGWVTEDTADDEWGGFGGDDDDGMMLRVERQNYFSSIAYALLTTKSVQPMTVVFTNEPGTGDGPKKEFFGLAAEEVFHAEHLKLFSSALGGESRRALVFPPAERGLSGDKLDERIKLYMAAGRLLGAAFVDSCEVGGVELARGYYKILLAHPLVLGDVRSLDTDVYNSLVYLLEADDVDSLDLSFVHTTRTGDDPPQTVDVALVPGGDAVAVTNANKHEFVRLKISALYTAGVEPFLQAFATGFWAEAPPVICRYILTADDLVAAFAGTADVNVDDWEAYTVYETPNVASSNVVKWLWRCLREQTADFRRKVLLFATGSPTLPIGGFRSLAQGDGGHAFTLYITEKGDNGQTVSSERLQELLPTAQTCFNVLV